MRVLSWSGGDDVGGVGWGMASAFNAVRPDWTYESVVGSPSWLQYPRHTPIERLDTAWAEADVVHLHEGFSFVRGPKPLVVTYHGTGFREVPGLCLEQVRLHRAVCLVPTLDLWLLAPDEVTWAPAPFDLDWLATLRTPVDDGVLRIGHCPTNRALKSTDAFLAAASRLGRELSVEVVMVEGRPWAECLPVKATLDVYFDQTLFGYGQNSVECWGMGIPVVAGADERTLGEMVRRFPLPFVQADESTIYQALRVLAEPDARAQWAARGLAHAERFHSQRAFVDLLEPIYRQQAA